jgi:isoleucyl-tRNA synthetase
MKDYKTTLNLPKTDFPMKANLPQREPELLKKWQDINLYKKMREQGNKHNRFILHDGPPYANGGIHLGTALNKTLKDIVVKSKTLSGFDAPFVPGWDCHGLPIELNIEKKLGKPGQKVSVKEFRQACREFATSQVNRQREEFKRLGVIADWDHPYLTMDYAFEADILRSLAKIIRNGHLQKGYKPVYWCLDCSSALAEAEVEYQDKSSTAIDVRFHVMDAVDFLRRLDPTLKNNKPISIPIWTTTPWTLPANQAVALSPDVNYALVDSGKELLLIADSLVPEVMARYNISKYQTIAKTLGEKFELVKLQHPFYERQVPVVMGEHVTMDSGTGAVHTAPAHGEDDYVVGKRYNLPLENPVGDDGCYISSVMHFAGQHVNKVNDAIIHRIKEQHNLLHSEQINHSYPHCWRHKTALIFRSTPQWFVSMDKKDLREKALAAVARVRWIPEWGQVRISHMIEKRPDWCISRQRVWGVPIALFSHKETGEPHPKSDVLMEKIAARVEKEGVDIWFDLDAKEFLGEEAKDYTKCTDILDVWFDSGVTHDCVLQKKPSLRFPADLYLEGSDQYRGWFNSSLVTSVAINDKEPYKAVVTHGYVLDLQARKMSKSLGNVIVPESIIKSLGADVLRLWVASMDYRAEINASEEIFLRTSETYRRIRNTARFLLSNISGFDPDKHLVPHRKMLALDRWAVDRAYRLQEEIIKAYDAYQFHLIYQRIHHFCTVDMGSFYLDVIKDRQYTTQRDSLARRSAQTAMFHIIEAMVRWIAPLLTFTAEEIWQFIPGKRNESVFLDTWYKHLFAQAKQDKMDPSYWEKIQRVRDAVNKEIETERNAGKLGSALQADVILYCESNLKAELDVLENELRFVLITSKADVELAPAGHSQGVKTDVPGLWVTVNASTNLKCERCWHRCSDIGKDSAHPTLCERCIVNVEGKGEIRKYV